MSKQAVISDKSASLRWYKPGLLFATPNAKNTGSFHFANNLSLCFSSVEIGQGIVWTLNKDCWLSRHPIKKHDVSLLRTSILSQGFSWSPIWPQQRRHLCSSPQGGERVKPLRTGALLALPVSPHPHPPSPTPPSPHPHPGLVMLCRGWRWDS